VSSSPIRSRDARRIEARIAVALAAAILVVVSGGCAGHDPSAPNPGRDTSQGIVICEDGEPGQAEAGQPGQPGEPGQAGTVVQVGPSGSVTVTPGQAGEPGRPGQPGQAQGGEPGRCQVD
jgi:hypothetical protein